MGEFGEGPRDDDLVVVVLESIGESVAEGRGRRYAEEGTVVCEGGGEARQGIAEAVGLSVDDMDVKMSGSESVTGMIDARVVESDVNDIPTVCCCKATPCFPTDFGVSLCGLDGYRLVPGIDEFNANIHASHQE